MSTRNRIAHLIPRGRIPKAATSIRIALGSTRSRHAAECRRAVVPLSLAVGVGNIPHAAVTHKRLAARTVTVHATTHGVDTERARTSKSVARLAGRLRAVAVRAATARTALRASGSAAGAVIARARLGCGRFRVGAESVSDSHAVIAQAGYSACLSSRIHRAPHAASLASPDGRAGLRSVLSAAATVRRA